MYRSPFAPDRFPDAGPIPIIDVAPEVDPVLQVLRDDPLVNLPLAQASPIEQAAELARAIFDHEAARSRLDLPDDRMDLPVALHMDDPLLISLLDTARTIHASDPDRWPLVMSMALEAVGAETRAVVTLPADQQIARDITNQTISPYELIYDDLPGENATDRLEHRYQGILNPGTLRSAPGSLWMPPLPGAYPGELPVNPTPTPGMPPQYNIVQKVNPDTRDTFYGVTLRETVNQQIREENLADFPSRESAESFISMVQANAPALEALSRQENVRAAGQDYQLVRRDAEGTPIYSPVQPERLRQPLGFSNVTGPELERYFKTGQMTLGIAGNALLPNAEERMTPFDKQALRHFAEQEVKNPEFYEAVPEGQSIAGDNLRGYVRSMGKERPEYTIRENRSPTGGASTYLMEMTGIPMNRDTLSRVWAENASFGVLRMGEFANLQDAQTMQASLLSPETRELQDAIARLDDVTVAGGTKYEAVFDDNRIFQYYRAEDRENPTVSLPEMLRYAYTGKLSQTLGTHLIQAQENGYEPNPAEQVALKQFAYGITAGSLLQEDLALEQSYAQLRGGSYPGPATPFSDLPARTQQYAMEHRFDFLQSQSAPVAAMAGTGGESNAFVVDEHGPRPATATSSTHQTTGAPMNLQIQNQFFPDGQGNPIAVPMIMNNGQPMVGFETEHQAQAFLDWMQENQATRLNALEKGEAVDLGGLQYVPAGVPGEYRAVQNGQALDRQIIDREELATAMTTGRLSPALSEQWNRAQDLSLGTKTVAWVNQVDGFQLRNIAAKVAAMNATAPAMVHTEPTLPASDPQQMQDRVQREAAAPAMVHTEPVLRPSDPQQVQDRGQREGAAASPQPVQAVAAVAGVAAASAGGEMDFQDNSAPVLKRDVNTLNQTVDVQSAGNKEQIVPAREQTKEVAGQTEEVAEQKGEAKQSNEQQSGQQKQSKDQNREEDRDQDKSRGQGQGQAAGPTGFHLFGGRTHTHYHTHNEAAAAPETSSAPTQPTQPEKKPSGPTLSKAASNPSVFDTRSLQTSIHDHPVTPQEVQALNQKVKREGLTPENQSAVENIANRKDATLKNAKPENHADNQNLTKSLDDLQQTVRNDQTPNVDPSVKEKLAKSLQEFAKALAEAIQRIFAAVMGRSSSAGPSM